MRATEDPDSETSGGSYSDAALRPARRLLGSPSGSTSGRPNPFTNVASTPGADDADEGTPQRPIGRRVATERRGEERQTEARQPGLHRTGEHRAIDYQTGEQPTVSPSEVLPGGGRRAATPSAQTPVPPVRQAGGRRAAFPLPDATPGATTPAATTPGATPSGAPPTGATPPGATPSDPANSTPPAPRGRRARTLPSSPSADQVPDESDEDDFLPRLTNRQQRERRVRPAEVPGGPATPTTAWSPPAPAGPDETRARGRRRRAVDPSTPASDSRTQPARADQEATPETNPLDPFAEFPRLPGFADAPGPGWSPEVGTPTAWDGFPDPLSDPAGPDLEGRDDSPSVDRTSVDRTSVDRTSVDRTRSGLPGEPRAALPGVDPEPTASAFSFGVSTHAAPERPSPVGRVSTTTQGDASPGQGGVGDVAPNDPVPTPTVVRRSVSDNDYPDDLRPRRTRTGAADAAARRPEDPRQHGTARPQDGVRSRRTPDVDAADDARAPKRQDRRPRQSGMSAPVGVIVGVGGSVVGAALDLVVTGGLGVLFSLCFVLTAFGVAAGIRRSEVFTAGVLPPLSALATFAGLGVLAPERVGGTSSHLGAVLSGLAAESWTLVAACALALGTIGLRVALGEAPPEVSAEEPLEDPSEAPGAARRSDSPRRS